MKLFFQFFLIAFLLFINLKCFSQIGSSVENAYVVCSQTLVVPSMPTLPMANLSSISCMADGTNYTWIVFDLDAFSTLSFTIKGSSKADLDYALYDITKQTFTEKPNMAMCKTPIRCSHAYYKGQLTGLAVNETGTIDGTFGDGFTMSVPATNAQTTYALLVKNCTDNSGFALSFPSSTTILSLPEGDLTVSPSCNSAITYYSSVWSKVRDFHYSWSVSPDGTNNFGIPDIGYATYYFPTPGIKMLTLTTTNICGSKVFTKDMQIGAVVNVSSDVTICDGESSILSVSGDATTYNWTGPDLPIGTTGNSITVSPHGTSSYTVTGGKRGCYTTKKVLVHVKPVPSLVLTPNTTICEGISTTLNATTNASNFNWSGNGLIPINNLKTIVVTPTISGNNNSVLSYRAQAEMNGCFTTLVTNVTVMPAPVPVLTTSNSQPECPFAPISITAKSTAVPAPTYNWSPIDKNTLVTSPYSVEKRPIITMVYTATASFTNGCIRTAAITVPVKTRASAFFTLNKTDYCLGEDILVDGTASTNEDTYHWEIAECDANGLVSPTITQSQTWNNGPVSGLVNWINGEAGPLNIADYIKTTNLASNLIPFNFVPDKYYRIKLIVQNCSLFNEMTKVFHVNSFQASTLGISPNSVICKGDIAKLSATGAVSYQWTGNTILGPSNTAAIHVQPSETSNYLVTGTNINGCNKNASVQVIVNQLPPAPIVTVTPTEVCPGGTISYSVSYLPGLTVSSTSPIGSSYLGGGGGPGGFSGNLKMGTSSGAFVVKVKDTMGCSASSSAYIKIQTISPPNAVITQTVCTGGNANYSVTSLPGLTYNQTFPPGATVLGGGGGPGGFGGSVQLLTSGNYSVTATSSIGCTGTTTIPVKVNPLPVVTAKVNTTKICANQPVILTAHGASTYSWVASKGTIPASGSPITITPSSSAVYTVTGTDKNSCKNKAVIVFDVINPPAPIINLTTKDVCPGGTTGFSVSYKPGLNVLATLPFGASNPFTSGGPGGFGGTLKMGNTSGDYIIKVTDGNGCTNITSSTINVLNVMPPAATITPIVCAGGKANYTVVTLPGLTYSQKIPQESTYIGGGGGNGGYGGVIQMGTLSDTYTVTATNSIGCFATTTLPVKVNPNPIITASSDRPFVCAGDPVSLNSSGATNLAWFSTGIPVGNGTSILVNPLITTTYTVIGTDINGCSKAAYVPISVSTLPSPAITLSKSAVCSGESLDYIFTYSGLIIERTIPFGSTFFGGKAVPGNFTGSIKMGVIGGPLTVTVKNEFGCTSSTSAFIDVPKIPTPSAILSNNTVCSGENIILNVETNPNFTYSQTIPFDAIVTYGRTDPGSYLNAIKMGNTDGRIEVKATNFMGCSNSALLPIKVNPTPSLAFSTFPILEKTSEPLILNQSSPIGGTYSGIGVSNNVFNPSTSGVGLFPVTYAYTDLNGCKNTTTQNIIVEEPCSWLVKGSEGITESCKMYADAFGNQYVTGYFVDVATFGSHSIKSNGYEDVYVVKYNSSGDVLWLKGFGGPADDRGTAIYADVNGDIYTAGNNYDGEFNYPGGPVSYSKGGLHHIYVKKFDSNGNEIWTINIEPTNNFGPGNYPINYMTTTPYSITADNNGNAYVTGTFWNIGLWLYIAKVNSSGIVWSYKGGPQPQYRGFTPNCIGHKIIYDGKNSIYVAGTFNKDINIGGSLYSVDNSSSEWNQDAFIAKMDLVGNVQYFKQLGGPSYEEAYGISLDINNNLNIVGSFSGTVGGTYGKFDGFKFPIYGNLGKEDMFLAQLNSNGTLNWAQQIGGDGRDRGLDVVNDAQNNIYVTAQTIGDCKVGTQIIKTPATGAILVSEFDVNGNMQWSQSERIGPGFSRNYDSYCSALGIDNKNNLYISGTFEGTAAFGSQSLSSVSLSNKVTYEKKICYRNSSLRLANHLDVKNVLEENVKNEMYVFPNPTEGHFKITFDKPESGVIIISDIIGRIVFQKELLNEENELNIDINKTGVYFLKFKGAEFSTTRKIIIR
jgi:hypothetical protein